MKKLMKKKNNLLLISDFNSQSFAEILNEKIYQHSFKVKNASYNQVYLNLKKYKNNLNYSYSIIWTHPERININFSKAFNLNEINEKSCLDEVDHFSNEVINFAKGKIVFLSLWGLDKNEKGYGINDWKSNLGLRNLLAKMNIRLCDRLKKFNNIYVLDFEKLKLNFNDVSFPKMWYATKIPYTDEYFIKVTEEIENSILSIQGKNKKIILLDLDNTIWGGVVGETGWKGIRLGGHDHIGEAYVDFQKKIKSLTNAGIQIGIVSKNDEKVALEVFKKHPEMILSINDIAGWRINWKDKSHNVEELLNELNLGKSSAVFIDDNPVEREAIKIAHKDILVPELPSDPCLYRNFLNNLDCFNFASISNEDRKRKKMYIDERVRRSIKNNSNNENDWLKKIDTKIKCKSLNEINFSRTLQLINKTNQLNLTTRRFTAVELKKWLEKKNNFMMTIEASDAFGEMGIVGILGLSTSGNIGIITDYVMSCRIMGRKVEDTLIFLAAKKFKSLKLNTMRAVLKPTKRNRPTIDVFKNSIMVEKTKNNFILKNLDINPPTKFIKITF
tara:strand:- start:1172 stop:2845 length:1674 start_codon:yes stop_codon:yes gene_type:complete